MPAPDGEFKILFSNDTSAPSIDLFLVNMDGTGLVQLTNTADRLESDPSWSRSGDRASATVLNTNGVSLIFDCFVYDLGLSTEGEVLVTDAYSIVDVPGSPLSNAAGVWDTAWSRTQDVIAVTADVAGYNSGEDIWLIDLASPGTPTNLTGDSGHLQMRASWSPDDSRLVFRQRIRRSRLSKAWSGRRQEGNTPEEVATVKRESVRSPRTITS